MNKLATFLLIFLATIMPIGSSMNIVLNANAIAESEYYTDQYMRYADNMLNYYEDEPSHADDDGSRPDQSSYGNDNYDRDNPSYKHPSESKDNERNIVSINNINCNTVNYNFNNNAIGNLSTRNSGIGGEASADDGSIEALSANTNENNEGYSDEYQKGKDITCISNINNNNTSVITRTPAESETQTCDECFEEFLTPDQIQRVLDSLEGRFATIDELCNFLLLFGSAGTEIEFIDTLVKDFDVTEAKAVSLVLCLKNAGIEFFEPDPTP